MTADSLAAAFERDHREIDLQIDAFLADPQEPEGLLRAAAALRRHIYLEEEYLFRALPDPAIAAPAFVMLREHAQLWQLLPALDEAVRTREPDAAAAQLCRRLAVLLQHHNGKEERVIYAAIATIPEPILNRIDEIMRPVAAPPEGWTCLKARG